MTLRILSPRQRVVLELLAEGSSNQEIADKLCITINTVETHLRRIYRKLGVRSRGQATHWYILHISIVKGGDVENPAQTEKEY